MPIGFTRDDLARLNDAYWVYHDWGEGFEDKADALRDIYYFCKQELDKAEGRERPPEATKGD